MRLKNNYFCGKSFEPAKDWKKTKMFENAREYTVSGLITEMILRDGKILAKNLFLDFRRLHRKLQFQIR